MASSPALATAVGGAADLLDRAATIVDACQALQGAATEAVQRRVAPGGRLDPERMTEEQSAAHGLAWLATYVEALRQLLGWAVRLDEAGGLGERERLLLETALDEYVARIRGGIPISQVELIRPADLGLEPARLERILEPALAAGAGPSGSARRRLAALIADGGTGNPGLDHDLEMMADQIRRFVDARVVPQAQR